MLIVKGLTMSFQNLGKVVGFVTNTWPSSYLSKFGVEDACGLILS